MRKLIAVVLAQFAFCHLHAQIQVGVWTDKSSYLVTDTIHIAVTAYNPGSDTVVLRFPSSCQVSYTIDDFNFINHVLCATVLTSRTIPPLSTVQWNYLKYPDFNAGWPQLSPGSHSLTGEVLGYARSNTVIVFVTSVSSVSEETVRNSSFQLGQNYPNPFNGTTIIPFSVSRGGAVRITVYNILGERVRTLLDEYRSSGSYVVRAELNDLPSGSYWCRLQMGGRSQTTKLVLSK
jgi:hypothetical protein